MKDKEYPFQRLANMGKINKRLKLPTVTNVTSLTEESTFISKNDGLSKKATIRFVNFTFLITFIINITMNTFFPVDFSDEPASYCTINSIYWCMINLFVLILSGRNYPTNSILITGWISWILFYWNINFFYSYGYFVIFKKT